MRAVPLQSERSFQAQVVALAEALGWRAYHSWTSIHSPSGFPDLVLVRRPWLILAVPHTDLRLVDGRRLRRWLPGDPRLWDRGILLAAL